MFLCCVVRGTNQVGIARVTFYAGVLVINLSWDTGCHDRNFMIFPFRVVPCSGHDLFHLNPMYFFILQHCQINHKIITEAKSQLK